MGSKPTNYRGLALDAGEAAYSGGNKFVIGGYDGIPTMLAGDTPIEYETIVDKITWGQTGYK
jgi:hypothetical protein